MERKEGKLVEDKSVIRRAIRRKRERICSSSSALFGCQNQFYHRGNISFFKTHLLCAVSLWVYYSVGGVIVSFDMYLSKIPRNSTEIPERVFRDYMYFNQFAKKITHQRLQR